MGLRVQTPEWIDLNVEGKRTRAHRALLARATVQRVVFEHKFVLKCRWCGITEAIFQNANMPQELTSPLLTSPLESPDYANIRPE